MGAFTFSSFGKKALGALSSRDRRPLIAFLECLHEQKTEKAYSSRRERFPTPGAKKVARIIIKLISVIIKKIKRFNINIEKDALENKNYRKVLYSGKHSQLALMSLRPKEEIGMEVHPENDPFFRIEKGQGKCVIDGNEYELNDRIAIIVPAGAMNNVINISETEDLKLYTIYSPAHHKDGIIRTTKKEAEANEAEFDGVTTE